MHADVEMLSAALALERRTDRRLRRRHPAALAVQAKGAKDFLNEELEHTGELISLIKAAGGTAPDRADSYDIGHARDQAGVLAVLHSLRAAADRELSAVDPAAVAGTGARRRVDDPRLRRPAHRGPARRPGPARAGLGLRHRQRVIVECPARRRGVSCSSPPGPALLTDTEWLERMLSIELLLLFAYEHVLGSAILPAGARRELAPVLAHEHAHVAALRAAGQPAGRPAPRLRRRASRPPTGTSPAARSPAGWDSCRARPDALFLLRALERVTVGVYFVALRELRDPTADPARRPDHGLRLPARGGHRPAALPRRHPELGALRPGPGTAMTPRRRFRRLAAAADSLDADADLPGSCLTRSWPTRCRTRRTSAAGWSAPVTASPRPSGRPPTSTPARCGSRSEPTSSSRSTRRSPTQDLDWGAIYHSHTRSEPYPSQTDINYAASWPGVLWIIVGTAGEEPMVRTYEISDGQVSETELEVA